MRRHPQNKKDGEADETDGEHAAGLKVPELKRERASERAREKREMRREMRRERERESEKEKLKEGGLSTAGLKADLVGRGGFGWQGWQKQPDLFPGLGISGSKFVDMQESGEVVRPQGMLG